MHSTVQLTFVTDPLCSWCWGTLPQFLQARSALQDRVDCRLMLAGIEVAPQSQLGAGHLSQLQHLWRQVHDLTGQVFSGRLPPEFRYHSEVACRAVHAARQVLGREPFDFFADLQAAFFLRAENINTLDCLVHLAESRGIPAAPFVELMAAPETIDATREEFQAAQGLGTQALPSILFDRGEGQHLLCGGYITAEFLVADVLSRLQLSTRH